MRKAGFLAIAGYVILLTLTDMALMVVIGAAILFLSCLSVIWEIVMRSLFAIACVSVVLSGMPAAADELYDLQQRVDDLEMRLNDLELARTPAQFPPIPNPDFSGRRYTPPVQARTPRTDDCEGACAVLKSQHAASEYFRSVPNCPPGALCGDGPLLRGDGNAHATADGRSK